MFFQASHLDDAASNRVSGQKAKNFLKVLEAQDCVYYLHFMLDVLTILSEVSAIFQKVDATIADILYEIECGIEHLEKLKTL